METKDINDLRGNTKNPRRISDHDYKKLVQSIQRFGDLSGVVLNNTTGQLVGGHQRVQAFKQLGGQPVVTERYEQPNSKGTVAIGYVLLEDEKYAYREVDWDKDFEAAANIAANRIQGEFDTDLLAELVYELSQLENADELLGLTGQTEDEIKKLLAQVSGEGEDEDNETRGNLADDFIAPPFSILDTKQGYWQARKRSWLDLGIKSEETREGVELFKGASAMFDKYRVDNGTRKSSDVATVSIFDPVLCEVAYRWYNLPGGVVLDPFAGGSVRGVIASKLGMQYVGLELRADQVEANRVQATDICSDPLPVWIAGDSNKTLDAVDGQADLLFSCPPYADLEVYSDDPDDLSNMPYPKFLEMYESIITKSCVKLKDNRFAVWVVGEVRSKDGAYYNFVGDTVKAFEKAGLKYYNEMILVNVAGTLPMRAPRSFNASRKIGKQHQNVLVFFKGDPSTIKSTYGPLDFSQMEDLFAKEIAEAKSLEPLAAPVEELAELTE